MNNQSNKFPNFWVCGGMLAILLASILARDITRPFYGLHSWAQASGAWAARSHVRYGLGYTKGISTWAVGQPPSENPKRYWDHPQLNVLIASFFMWILGINEWSLRVTGIIFTVASFLMFLKILKHITDHKTALLAGLIFALFPLTGYFGLGGWATLMWFIALWCYLVLIKALKDGPEPARMHRIGLAVSLFLAIQFGWPGFFCALGIGVHYVGRCLFRRQAPSIGLLAILVLAPLSSMLLNFTVMAAGYGWDIDKILALYKWRSAKAELTPAMPKFNWGMWFAQFWQFAVTNFTKPILITAITYLTAGQLIVFTSKGTSNEKSFESRRFPQFWLFFLTPVFQLFILRGCLWRHQTWERPFGPFIAIAAAQGILLLASVLKKIHPKLSTISIAALLGLFFVFCARGTNYYYAVRWQSPAKIRLFKMLNQMIPPDKALLSFEDHIVNQHSSKGGFYRPEVAWYLDREIVPAKSVEEVERLAKTGRYPYYLIPYVQELVPRINKLSKRYKYIPIPREPGESSKDGKPLKASMTAQMIFELGSPRKSLQQR